jgi:YhcH/YjgK/YiaL family protein
MIIGSIKQKQLTDFLSQTSVLRRALEWICSMPPEPAEGITELEGRDLYVSVHGYSTRAREDCCWESHRRTADLQFGLNGGELIDWSPIQYEGTSANYDAPKDFEIWPEGIVPVNTLLLERGLFAIFLPGELHRPMITDGKNASVQKLVVKIHARFLPHGMAV